MKKTNRTPEEVIRDILREEDVEGSAEEITDMILKKLQVLQAERKMKDDFKKDLEKIIKE